MDTNQEIIRAIVSVKNELNRLRSNKASRAEQLDCFQRLVSLYGALNIPALINKKDAA